MEAGAVTWDLRGQYRPFRRIVKTESRGYRNKSQERGERQHRNGGTENVRYAGKLKRASKNGKP